MADTHIISTLVAVLIGLIGWIGNQVRSELRDIKTEIAATNKSLGAIERDLRGDLSELDRRVTKVEAACYTRRTGDGR